MKLKEKFLDHVYCFMGSGMLTNTYDEQIANWNAEKCEIIADDLAIGFAEWIEKNVYYNGYKHVIEKTAKEYTVKQLLKIYKEENKL